MLATIDATTMTDSVQQPVVEMSEKSTQVDRAPCLQPSTPPLKHHDRLTSRRKIYPDKQGTPSSDVQAATQTNPPSHNYQDELAAQIALVELAQQRHNEAIAQLREQAASQEADLKQLLAERSTTLQEKKERFWTFSSLSPRPKKDSSRKRRGIADEKNYEVRTRSYNKWQTNTYTCGRSLKNKEWHCLIHITTYK